MTTRASRDEGPVVTEDPAVTEAEPAEFPVDFDEWAQPLREGIWRLVVSGFEHATRVAGQLRERHTKTQWQERFETWRTTPTT
jgi:hypothetical protein